MGSEINMNYLYVAIGGAIGSVFRYFMMNLVGYCLGNNFPYATIFVNISGSLIMGLLIGWLANNMPANSNEIRIFLAVGVLGGYTTFSSFSLDAINLLQNGKLLAMTLYITSSVMLSLAGYMAGIYLIKLSSG
ncbi:MAG: fluoride efflux transporter CrcB [Pseudomonadota bacterium]